MDDPNQPFADPPPAPEERRLNGGNLMLGCLNGFGIVAFGVGAFLSFVGEEPVAGAFITLLTLGLMVLLFRQHFVQKQRSHLLGALLFIGFAALLFGLCVAVLMNADFR